VVAGGFVIGTVLAYESFRLETFTDVQLISWAIESSFAASTAIDFLISMSMCFYLRKSKGLQSRLNSRISTVMQYSLSSGLFTSACSLSCLFTYILLPNTLVYLGLEFLLTKLYVGSFLAMLNARQRSELDNPGDTEGVASYSVGLPSLTIRTPTSRTAYDSPNSSNSDRSRKYPWDMDVEGNVVVDGPKPALHSKHHYAHSHEEKPSYMQRW